MMGATTGRVHLRRFRTSCEFSLARRFYIGLSLLRDWLAERCAGIPVYGLSLLNDYLAE